MQKDIKIELVPDITSILKDTEDQFFYSREWINTLKNTYNYDPVFFVIYEKEKPLSYVPFLEVNSFTCISTMLKLCLK